MSLIASLALLGTLAPVFAADKSLPELVADLRGHDLAARASAERGLIAAGEAAVDPVVRAASEQRRLQGAGLAIVAAIGPKAVPALLKLLDEPQTRDQAGRSLFQAVRLDSCDSVGRLFSCLGRPEVQNYCWAALVRAAGPSCAKFSPRFVQSLKSADTIQRVYAAAALGQIGGRSVEVVAALGAALKDSEPPVRSAAAAALGKFGPRARQVVAALEAAQNDVDGEVRLAAKEALLYVR